MTQREVWTCGHVGGAVCAECYHQLARKAHEVATEMEQLKEEIERLKEELDRWRITP